MLRSLLRDESNQFRVVDDPSAISDIMEHLDRLLWLDLEQPTAADFATVRTIDDPFPAIAPIKPRTTAELQAANPRVLGHSFANETATVWPSPPSSCNAVTFAGRSKSQLAFTACSSMWESKVARST